MVLRMFDLGAFGRLRYAIAFLSKNIALQSLVTTLIFSFLDGISSLPLAILLTSLLDIRHATSVSSNIHPLQGDINETPSSFGLSVVSFS